MRIHTLIAALLFAAAAPVVGQPAPVKDQAISDFVDAHAAITRIGKIARWEDAICMKVVGLPPGFTKFVTGRVKEVAATAGAPVDASPSCKSNIDIVFTTNPQALLDEIRSKQPLLLGYYDSTSQAEQMAKVVHPIQSWYATATVDLHGKPQIDFRHANVNQTYDPMDSQAVTGGRLGDGLRSALYHVTIVADPSKLGDHEIGALADNIAVLALAAPQSVDSCTELPSILNLTTPACHADAAPKAMTVGDTGYLRGLYQLNLSGMTLRSQKDGIVYSIKEAQAAH